VSLPRFKLTSSLSLAPTLSAMGMPSAFDRADFSGIGGPGEISISQVLCKAFIEINETGTEAVAATAVTMTPSVARSPKRFKVDHAFVYLIRDSQSGTVLFMGRLDKP